MSKILSDTMHAAENGAESAKNGAVHALGTARREVESVRRGTMHTLANALSMVLETVSAGAGILSTLRKLDRDDGLAWFGLARRRSPLLTVAVFGAGAATGAGLALLFAPMSGADLRRAIQGRVAELAPKTEPEPSEGKPLNGGRAASALRAVEPASE